MSPFAQRHVRRSRFILGAFVTFALAALAPAQAAASNTPDLQLSGGSVPSVLFGHTVRINLTASLAAGEPKGYNAAYRVVLAPGVTYVPGSAAPAAEPREVPVGPAPGDTTLQWDNESDLVGSSDHTLSFRVSYDQTMYDAGDTLPFAAGAYISTDPIDETDWNNPAAPITLPADGDAPPGVNDSWTGFDTLTSTTSLSAIEVTKSEIDPTTSEPHPEGELLRGVHDHQTVYTLTIENNPLHPTDAVSLVDYLPAGLEFLGCAGATDHTANAPTNPSNTEEYAGSGPIVVNAPASNCVVPGLVDTIIGSGPLPASVYTHVKWGSLGNFAPGQTMTLKYAAAIPIRENTMAWSGATPGTTGQQASNLDNNSGPETTDEQALVNAAIVAGTYKRTGKPDKAVSHENTLLVTAEDIAIQKSTPNTGLEQGEVTTWSIDVEVSEYRSADDLKVHDRVPDGLCPLGPATTYERSDTGDPPVTTECNNPLTTGGTPVAGPSDAYTTVDETSNGTYDIEWTQSTVPWMAHMQPNQTGTITFATRTRTHYQENWGATSPILARDSVTNAITANGKDWVRCTGGVPDCTTTGTKIDHDEVDGQPDFDVSSAGKAGAGVVIDKQVAASYPASGDCNDPGISYGDTLPAYGPSDQVCWKLRIDFPANLNTHSQDVYDYLPSTVLYVVPSMTPTGNNTSQIFNFLTPVGTLHWELGNANIVDANPAGTTFEVTYKTTVGSPLGHHSGDVEGNLMKFSYENTAGRAWALRDRADFELRIPELDVAKGVTAIKGPNHGDHFDPPADNQHVQGGDEVHYAIDVTNSGTANATSSRIWDELPLNIHCSDVTSISGGGYCDLLEDRIVWPSVPVAASSTVTLTYVVKIPAGISPGTCYANTAGVVEVTYLDNEGEPYQLVPDNPAVRDPDLGPANMPAAEDGSVVCARKATVVKTRATSISEGGNDAVTEAAIGEAIDYTVTVTIPEGTTMYGTPTVVDDLGTRQALVAGTLSGTLNGGALPAAGITLSAAGSVITTTFPATYANPTGDDVLVLTFSATVLDVNANVRGAALPNDATLQFASQDDVPQAPVTGTVQTTIVEPNMAITKTHTPSGTIAAGQVVDTTITVTNPPGANVSTAHDVVVKDLMPAGTLPVLTGASNDVAGPQNGHWVGNDSTITWDTATTPALFTLSPGASIVLHYQVVIGSSPVAGNCYPNVASVTVTSLGAPLAGIRTPDSTSSTAPDYEAEVVDNVCAGIASIAKEATPDKITIGDSVTWKLTVTLPLGLQYYDAIIADALPDGFELDGPASIVCPACPPTDPLVAQLGASSGSGPLQSAWYLGDLAVSSSDREYLIEAHGHLRDTYANGAKVKDGETLTNAARVGSNGEDRIAGTPTTIPGSDYMSTATATNHVVEPKLKITKSADTGAFVGAGEVVTYTIAITNTGTAPAYDVVVEDLPDSELLNVTPVLGAGFNTGPWISGGPPMRWEIPGPIAPGATVTLTYTAQVKPASVVHADDQITNTADIVEYWGVPETTRNAHPWVFRQYDGPQSTVTLIVAIPRLTIVKSPDDCMVIAGSDATFTITVTNQDTHATANGVVVTDTLAAGLTYTPGDATADPDGGPTNGGFSETSASGQSIAWLIASLAPGATVTITVPVHVGAGVPEGTVLVNSASTHSDEVPDEQTDTGSLIVEAKADLKVTKASEPGPEVPGTNVVYTIVLTNEGTSDALNSKLADTLPPYLSFVSIDDATHCVVTGQLIECDFGTLAPGATHTIHVTAKLDASRTTPIKNVVDVTTTTAEAHDANNRAKAVDDVAPKADVSVHKTASGALFDAGDTVTYTLVAHNDGPSVALGVTIDDDIPDGLAFVSVTPGAPVCTHAAGHVHCDLGSLAPGADGTVTVVATANGPTAGGGASGSHPITTSQLFQLRVLAPGQTTTVDLVCGANGSASDGATDAHGLGGIDVQVKEARSIARGTYRFTVKNGAAGSQLVSFTAQCLPRDTDPGSHTHQIELGALQTLTTGALAPGRHVRTIAGAAGTRAVAPGFEVLSGAARIAGSEPAGSNGRTFTIDVLATAEVELSMRPLDENTGPGGVPAHVHPLGLTHVSRTALVSPGASTERVSCPADHAAVAASYDLPAGLVLLGNAASGASYVAWLQNTTPHTVEAMLDIECIAALTGEPVGGSPVVNTATTHTTTSDPIGENDHDSATIGVRPHPTEDPEPGPGTGSGPGSGTGGLPLGPTAVPVGGPETSAPVGPTTTLTTAPATGLVLGSVGFSSNASHLTVSVACRRAKTCNGRVTVTAPSPNRPRSAASAALKTITLGRAGYTIKPHKTAKIRVKIAQRYRAMLRSGRIRTVTITSGSRSVKRKVVLPKAKRAGT